MHIQHVGHLFCLLIWFLLGGRRLVTLDPSCTARTNWKKPKFNTVKNTSWGTQEFSAALWSLYSKVANHPVCPHPALLEPLLCLIHFSFLLQKPASNRPGIHPVFQLSSKSGSCYQRLSWGTIYTAVDERSRYHLPCLMSMHMNGAIIFSFPCIHFFL